MAPFSYQEPESPFEMLMAGARGYGNLQDIRQKSKMNPLLLQQQQIENAIKEYEKQYKPATLQADTASKMAYANLMGPQFISKLMGNTDILANIPENQRQQALNMLIKSGMNQGSVPQQRSSEDKKVNQENMFSNPFVKQILASVMGNKNTQNNRQNITPDISSLPPEIQTNITKLHPGESYTIPEYNQSENRIPNFAETAAQYRGIQSEGEESGKARAKDIEELGNQYQSNLSLNDKFNTFSNLINNPDFSQMRSDIPFFQDKQLKVLSKLGSPYQQELIGTFKNTADEIIRDTVNSFSGQRLKGELDISKNMKVSDNDTFNVMVGKVKSAMTYKDLNSKRIELTTDIMEKEHISKRKALEKADKMLDSQSVINNINKQLDYPIQVRSKKTGKIETIPVSEARRRNIPNV